MAAFSDYLELAILVHTLENGASLGKATLYLALIKDGTLKDDGTYNGTGAEVTVAGNYTRLALTSSSAWDTITTAGVSVGDNDGAMTFGTASANWGSIQGFGIYDSLNSGGTNNLYYHGAIVPTVQINSGDTFEFAANGSLSITLD